MFEFRFHLHRFAFAVGLTTLLLCSSSVASEDSRSPIELVVVETSAPQSPTPQPAEGSLSRKLLGVHGWMQIDGDMQYTFSENNHSAFLTPHGSGNLPVVPTYEGFSLNNAEMYFHKDLKSDSILSFGPLPGPKPGTMDVGYQVQLVAGRISAARLGGWDQNWGINQPSHSGSETSMGLVIPNAYADVYLPVLNGMNLIAGLFGSGVGYEIHPNVRNTPNRFASHTYSMMSEPDQVFGAAVTGNLFRGNKGLLGYEFGVNNGIETLHSPNGKRNYQGALRYKTNNMKNSVDYSFFLGDAQINPAKNSSDFPGTGWHGVISPRPQFYQYHSLAAVHTFNEQWSAWSELAIGRQDGDGKSNTIQLTTGKGGFSGAEWGGLTVGTTYKKRSNLWYSARYEHFRDGNGYQIPPAVASAYNAFTAGVHYDLNRYIQFRPELRYDWQNSYRGYAYHSHSSSSQLTGTVDMVVYF